MSNAKPGRVFEIMVTCVAMVLAVGVLAGCGSTSDPQGRPEPTRTTGAALGDDGGDGGQYTCAIATLTASPAGQHAPGTQVTLSAGSTGCPSPLYEFWILPPGGSWSVLQAYGNSATFNWDTTGLAPGDYELGVWAKDASSPTTSYDTTATTSYALGASCATVSVIPSPAGPQVPGTQITLTAASTGCSNPLYEFWVLPPGGSWTSLGPYGGSATFTWDTTGLAPGVYELGVWAKDATSPTSTYDVSGTASYSIGRTCAAVSLDAAPAGLHVPGTQVALTAASSGCPTPLYEFWVLPPGGGWTSLVAYGAAATFTWNTTGLAPGLYELGVWTKDSESPTSNYDASATAAYALCASCDTVTLGDSPGRPLHRGTQVSLTCGITV